MILLTDDYVAINSTAKMQAQSVLNRRNTFTASQKGFAAMVASSDRDAYQINAGIPTKDFYQEVDRTMLSVRTQPKFKFVQDLSNGLVTPVNLGTLSQVNLTASDISDDVVRTMDLQGLRQFDTITTGSDKNPVPGFLGGVGMNYRQTLGLQREGIDLMLEGVARKTIKMNEDIGLYMLEGDSKVVADGQAGEGVKNHRNTRKLNLGSTGYNIDLTATATTNDAIYKFFQSDMKLVCNDEVISVIDKFFVSPQIMVRLLADYSNSQGFKDGTLLDHILKLPHIGSIEEDFALTGNEFLSYVRDKQIISPLVAMPLTNYQQIRMNPYDNFNTVLIGVMGLKIAKTYNNKHGVFYASEID